MSFKIKTSHEVLTPQPQSPDLEMKTKITCHLLSNGNFPMVFERSLINPF